MFKRPAILLFLFAIALGAIAAGCGDDGDGGDGGDETITTSSLSKKEFIKQANAICGKAEKESEDGWVPYLKEHEDDGVSKEVLWANAQKAVMLPPIEAEMDAIRELGAPSGDEDQIEAFLVTTQELVDGTEETEKVKSFFVIDPAYNRAASLASKYGIAECP